jgi:hypothetical protein
MFDSLREKDFDYSHEIVEASRGRYATTEALYYALCVNKKARS